MSESILFEKVTEEWLVNSFFQQKRSTKLKYEVMIENHIKPYFGALDVKSVDETVINGFLADKLSFGRLDRKGGLSSSYVKTMAVLLNSIMNYAVSREYCMPLKTKISKPVSEKKEIIVMSAKEQISLENRLKYDYSLTALGVMITLNAGLRIGELCALRWDDIDMECGIIHVRCTVARVKTSDAAGERGTKLILDRPKTKTSMRDIPVTTKLLELLKIAKKRAKSPYVISMKENFISPRTFEYRFHRLLALYGMPDMNFHALRHTFATRCVELNVDVKTLSEVLGHASVGITLNTYVHPSFELKRTQLEKLSDLF